MVQRIGGNFIDLNFIGFGKRTIKNSKVKNIEVESGNHPFDSHSDMDSKNVWEQINE